jgi:DNA-3-methyladenine glycosylase II
VSERLTIEPRGPFSLRAAAQFAFGPTEGHAPAFDGVMRLAFPIDGGDGYAGVVARQPREHGAVECELHGGGDAAPIERQLARVLSLDHDGEAFLEVGGRDRVIGELQRRYPGTRPVLFHSPYEAAAWSVISARRQQAQAAAVRRGLGIALGRTFELAGEQTVAFPQPQRLLEAADELPGVAGEKAARLRAVARAALDGSLDVATLHALGPQAAWSALQELPGIGPFYAGLVVLRAGGFADAPMPMAEPRILAHVARYYDLAAPATLEQFNELAENWRPFRTWASVLLRLAGDREFGRRR